MRTDLAQISVGAAAEHAALGECECRRAVQQLGLRHQIIFPRPHELRLHLKRHQARRDYCAMRFGAASSMRHANIQQRHHQTAMRHLPRIEQFRFQSAMNLGLPAFKFDELKTQMLNESDLKREFHITPR